ncbi:MAG TPA: hypothetical protein VEH83_12305 [Gemmatimonadales bacterium]|nr:hypothetical protein [Gemmatimonadales bacterium]
MNVHLALVCDHAIIDQHGKLSVLGIFDRIWVERFPAIHPRLHLVLRLKGRRTEIGDHSVLIQLVDAQGQEVLRGEGNVAIGEPPAGVVEIEAAAVLAFDVPLEKPGVYTFEIAVDGAHAASVPVSVLQMQAPAHPAPPQPPLPPSPPTIN